MNSRLRTALCTTLCVALWLSFATTTAEAQIRFGRAGVNQYYGGYGGYGGYGYQPRYYGGYGNGYTYGDGTGYTYGNGTGYTYGNGTAYYGNSWNGYQSSYPANGYNRAYGAYGGYPVYSSGYRGTYYRY